MTTQNSHASTFELLKILSHAVHQISVNRKENVSHMYGAPCSTQALFLYMHACDLSVRKNGPPTFLTRLLADSQAISMRGLAKKCVAFHFQ